MANPTIENHDTTPLIIANPYYSNQTIVAGQDLQAGSVLGVITASGKLKLVEEALDPVPDGSEVARFVLTQDVNAVADTVVSVLKAGVVNAEKLIFGDDETWEDHEIELRDACIMTVETKTYQKKDNQ